MSKVISAKEAAALINDNATICSAASGLSGWAEEVAIAVEERFLSEGHPRNITHVHAPGLGDWVSRGECQWIQDGLMTTVISSHSGSSPKLFKAIQENKVRSFNIPLGTLSQLFREIARKGPGLYSKTGLGTYIDPRNEGGKVNKLASENPIDLSEVHIINGEEWMFYKKIHLDVGLLRGTTADEFGNVTIEKEAITLDMLAVAQAVKACGGIVIVEVERLAKTGSLYPKLVKVPGIYVDYIVISQHPERIAQTQAANYYNASFSGEIKVPMDSVPAIPLDNTKIVCRRAAMELVKGDKVNFAIGAPTFMPSILVEENLGEEYVTSISELGSIGGIPGAGKDFGAHWNLLASCDLTDHVALFEGGNLDVGIFGLSEVDKNGNVNTSLLNGRPMGVGGFMNVSSNAKTVIFIGDFTAGGYKCKVEDGKMIIVNEGKHKKFVNNCVQISFFAEEALRKGNKILFVSERCVIERNKEGMVLKEIAPGIDLQTQVLDQMEFKPIIPDGGPKLIDPNIFQPVWGKLMGFLNAK